MPAYFMFASYRDYRLLLVGLAILLLQHELGCQAQANVSSVADPAFVEENDTDHCADKTRTTTITTTTRTGATMSCTDAIGREVCSQLLTEDRATDVCVAEFPRMRRDCRATCGFCQTPSPDDDTGLHSALLYWSRNYHRTPQLIARPEARERFLTVERYMYDEVYVNQTYANVRQHCVDTNKECTVWAAIGECERHVGYMLPNCPASCMACDMLNMEKRCPLQPQAPDVLSEPGQLNALMDRILTEPDLAKYSSTLLTAPTLSDDDRTPYTRIITLDGFLSPEECDALIGWGHEAGFERSTLLREDSDATGRYGNRVDSTRTSGTAWCRENPPCQQDPIVQTILDRIVLLTGVPKLNYEYLQLLRYEETQRYDEHSDYIDHQLRRQAGVRILTVYLYLSDVKKGGGTEFGRLHRTVQPQRGRAVIWPSVLDRSPNEKDDAIHHAALPVVRGVKYGANAWIHQRDFQGPVSRGCE